MVNLEKNNDVELSLQHFHLPLLIIIEPMRIQMSKFLHSNLNQFFVLLSTQTSNFAFIGSKRQDTCAI